MDPRTLAVNNIIFLFLYAAIAFVHMSMDREVRGGRWFAWSNLSRGAALLLPLGGFLNASWSAILTDCLLILGATLLHRGYAEILGRGRLAWNVQATLGGVALLGVSCCVCAGAYRSASALVAVVLAVQLSLTAAVLLNSWRPEMRTGLWFTVSILFASAILLIVQGVALVRYPDADLAQLTPGGVAALQLGRLLANGGLAFGFILLSGAQVRMQLTRQADRDALTGLLNRRGLKTLAEQALTRSHRAREPLSAVMLDLDGMKTANDTWGHECGDELLCAVAGLLVRSIDGQGAVARLGGDEFLVVLPGMAMGGAMEIAENLRQSIESLHVARCAPRASFGVASTTGNSWEEAVRRSDRALYEAKQAGRNRVVSWRERASA